MKSPFKAIFYLSLAAFILAVPAFAMAQTFPAADPFTIRKINSKNSDYRDNITAWVPTGNKKAILFYLDKKAAETEYTLYSFKMNSRGRISGSGSPVITGIPDQYTRCSVVWVNSQDGPGHGVLFMSYRKKNNKMVVFTSTIFNSEGIRTTGEKTLWEKQVSSEYDEIASYDIASTRQGDEIGVSFFSITLTYSPNLWAYSSSSNYFAKTDLNGKITSFARSIKMPVNPHMKVALSGKPAWNGKYWLVPGRVTNFREIKPSKGAEFVSEDLLMTTVKKDTGPLKAKTLTRTYSKSYMFGYASRLFPLTDVSADANVDSPEAENMTLLVRRRSLNDYDPNREHLHTYSYYLQPLKKNGKKAGATIPVEFPEWVRDVAWDNKKRLVNEAEDFSEVSVTPEGKYLLSMVRSFAYIPDSSNSNSAIKYETEFGLYSIDPDDGTVTTVARSKPDVSGLFSTPLNQWFNNGFGIINVGYLIPVGGGPSIRVEYFSKIKVD